MRLSDFVSRFVYAEFIPRTAQLAESHIKKYIRQPGEYMYGLLRDNADNYMFAIQLNKDIPIRERTVYLKRFHGNLPRKYYRQLMKKFKKQKRKLNRR